MPAWRRALIDDPDVPAALLAMEVEPELTPTAAACRYVPDTGHVARLARRRAQRAWEWDDAETSKPHRTPRDLRSKYMLSIHTPCALPGAGTPGGCRRRRRLLLSTEEIWRKGALQLGERM